MKKQLKFDNSNLRLVGSKMDINGNACYTFKYPNGRAFSIQAQSLGSKFAGWNFRLEIDPNKIFKNNSDFSKKELEAAAIGYISVFGSKAQKQGLRVFKS